MKRPLLILGPSLLVLLGLSACGMRESLGPAPGQHMPPAPAMASRAMTTDELIAPPAIARPERLDELLQRSEERHDDRFDLPPGDSPAGGGNVPAASGNVPANSNSTGDAPQ
jgi:hypothetical protein